MRAESDSRLIEESDVPRVSTRSRSTQRVVAAVAAVTVAIVATTSSAPAGASGRDTVDDGPTAGFVFTDGRYSAFEARGAPVEIVPSGVNDRGAITGAYVREDGESGFVRDEAGTITTFDVAGARGTEAVKINDRGQVVGRYSLDAPFVDDSSRVHGYLRNGDTVTRIDHPGATDTLPTGINDRGDVVGYYVDDRGGTHGFVWRDGRFSPLKGPNAAAVTPVDINDRGDVVGLSRDRAGTMQGVLLSDGRVTTFAAPGAARTVPLGINDAGQIVGSSTDEGATTGPSGFLLADGADGSFTPVVVPDAPWTLPLGINDRGQVVGLHQPPDVAPGPREGVEVGPSPTGLVERSPGVSSDVDLATVSGITVNAVIAEQIAALLAAAQADGVRLSGGGYRDHARQIELRRAHCGTSDYAIYEMPAASCSPPTARPGSSMHERGLAIDFSCDGALIRSRSERCFRWLAANAVRYGLYNLPSEPWHWSTTGS